MHCEGFLWQVNNGQEPALKRFKGCAVCSWLLLWAIDQYLRWLKNGQEMHESQHLHLN